MPNASTDIVRTPIESKLLKSVGYDPATRELHVEFSKGSVYTYHDVSPEKHAEMMAAKSVGGHFLANVKNAHKFTKR